MGRPYGIVKKKNSKPRRTQKGEGTAFKIKLRGRDGAPLTMQEMRDGLYEAARKLQRYEETHRAQWVTVYLTLIDGNGEPALPDRRGEWVIQTYKCAAETYEI